VTPAASVAKKWHAIPGTGLLTRASNDVALSGLHARDAARGVSGDVRRDHRLSPGAAQVLHAMGAAQATSLITCVSNNDSEFYGALKVPIDDAEGGIASACPLVAPKADMTKLVERAVVQKITRMRYACKLHVNSRHHLAVQVPSGVPEHGHDDDETKECGY
jgi:hypothetical protein